MEHYSWRHEGHALLALVGSHRRKGNQIDIEELKPYYAGCIFRTNSSTSLRTQMIPQLPYHAGATQRLFVLGLLVREVLPCPVNLR